MSEPVKNVEQALHATLRAVREGIHWSQRRYESSLRDVSHLATELREARAQECDILTHLAQNGWEIPVDGSSAQDAKPPF